MLDEDPPLTHAQWSPRQGRGESVSDPTTHPRGPLCAACCCLPSCDVHHGAGAGGEAAPRGAAGAGRAGRRNGARRVLAGAAATAPATAGATAARRRGVGTLLPGMEALAHRGVGQGGRGFVGELVALGGEHGQGGASQAGMVL